MAKRKTDVSTHQQIWSTPEKRYSEGWCKITTVRAKKREITAKWMLFALVWIVALPAFGRCLPEDRAETERRNGFYKTEVQRVVLVNTPKPAELNSMGFAGVVQTHKIKMKDGFSETFVNLIHAYKLDGVQKNPRIVIQEVKLNSQCQGILERGTWLVRGNVLPSAGSNNLTVQPVSCKRIEDFPMGPFICE